MFPYDSALLPAVQSTPVSIADVLTILRTIDGTCADGDGLKWFNWLYLQVTEAVEARIVAGGFSAPAWLAALDVQFARLYFNALAASLLGQPVPDCWQALFERRNQAQIARIQFAFAGINAHINHDLAEAIVATCTATGSVPAHSGVLYTDYTALNSTLDSLIDQAKHTLDVRLLGDALPPAAQLENTLAAWSVSAARESAWRNAEILWHLRASPDLSSAFMNSLDGLSSVAGNVLLVPVP
ncbi:DUF5995 family protein [Acidobacterium sp. S8]|uniref:DUF5995 family protein n=1 Tax=Acidobacterium sp. S8 TaxID=1641854 RepID=UPI00131B2598|nr:DUF5995 family protein [Acidobacterium sp. S8]